MTPPTPSRDLREQRKHGVFVVEQAQVYRAGGRRYFSRAAAIRRYAKEKFFTKHPCECEAADYADNYPGYNCGSHDAWEKVRPRYLRWILAVLRKLRTT